MDPCLEARPRVINSVLLERCIDEQLPPGEAGRLARIDGVSFDEVTQIRLEYFRILKIDHLWVLKSLTNLSLNNNLIERIENLETLVNLEQLDLSFNKITKIENLDALVKLEKLSLYENLIEVIENMDELVNLRIFSIGKNQISDRNGILYLRRFKNLTSLSMAGNPCSEEKDFRFFVAAFLPNILYYEYKKIQDNEMQTGSDLFKMQLDRIKMEDAKAQALREKKEQEEEDAKLNSRSFVEYLNTSRLFDDMFENDEEGNTFLLMGEDIEEYYAEFRRQFLECCMQLFQVGQKHYGLRQHEVDAFQKSFLNAKKSNQERSMITEEEFNTERKRYEEEVRLCWAKMDQDHTNYDPTYGPDNFNDDSDLYSSKYNDLSHATWKKLMKLEIELYEQLEELIGTLDHTLGELVNNFIEEAQAIFTTLRSIESNYNDNLSDEANKFITTLTIGTDIDVESLPEKLKIIMSDKETLISAISATRDMHNLMIDNREDRLTSRVRNWYETLISDITRNEILRNRNKVLEINHLLDIRREEFEAILISLTPKEQSSSEDEEYDNSNKNVV